MKKPVSARRQKTQLKSSLTTVDHELDSNEVKRIEQAESQLSVAMEKLTLDNTNLQSQIDDLKSLVQNVNSSLIQLSADLHKSNATLQKIEILESKVESLQKNYTAELAESKQQIVSVIQQELKNYQTHILSVMKEIGKNEFSSIISLLKMKKDEIDLERTLSFQLGRVLIDSKKSIEHLINLPQSLRGLREEAVKRKRKTVLPEQVEPKVIEGESKKVEIIQPKNIVKDKLLPAEKLIENKYPLIDYSYYKQFWPKTTQTAKFISILDEISENSWQNVFRLFPLNKNNYENQIKGSTSQALFIESCWKGNSGTWEYAFTSPGLKHANAQALLKALETAKSRNLPIVFWNKEDPMHYEKFLPIAEKCDIIFTTDENKVADYKRDLPGKKVYSLVFAANPFICNPVNRSRYEQETICFAGSYYSVGHDDRKVQMDTLLPALLEFNGAIYDRMSALNNERYFFPEQYRHLIRDGVDFKTMSVLYKHFKIFLNVNTITDSPTMMSRRVYELLACGTPVISTPSLALEKQFPGIVQIANNAEEAVKIAKELLQDEWKYKHLAHRGYREVMLKHTYQHRVKDILSSLDIDYDASPAKVSILMATMREHYIDRILENLGRQTYQNLELFIVTQGFSAQGVAKLKAGLDKIQNIKYYQVLEINTEMTLGERLNKAAALATGEYLAKMDDDDFYFDNYLTDMVIPFSYGNFALVGKKEIFIYLESQNKTVIKYPEQSHRITDFVSGATLVIKKNIFDQVGGFNSLNKSEDSTLIEKIKALKLPIYAADPFNFMVWRSNDTSNHTWQVGDEEFLKNSVVFNGFDTGKVCI